ncbi:MAG: type IV pilin N-terminal domain-containing protein [Archaeoglobaceae archaeon]
MRMDEKGVSPVIGVILMVAITVILAAVIASFVFGLGGSVKRTYNLAFTVTSVDKTNVVVKYMGGQDHAYVDSCVALVDGSPITGSSISLTIGASSSIAHSKSGQSFDFTIVCTFKDGSQQVVFSTRLTAPST